MSDDRSPEEIEASIEATREQLSEDLDRLGEKLSPEGLKEQAIDQIENLGATASGAVEGVAASVTERAEAAGASVLADLRDQPFPLALLGAALGVGYLMARSARHEPVDQTAGEHGSRYTEETTTSNTGSLLLGAAALAAGAAIGLFIPKNPDQAARAASAQRGQGSGLHLRERIRVRKNADELYAFWRDLSNLPQVMSHLKEVSELSDGRSHWVAEGPAGTTAEWDARITDDRPSESIAWRSEPGSQVPNEGAVGFRQVSDTATDIIVSLTYHPPGGALGAAVANLLGRSPQQQISDDLETFKEKVEDGSLNLTNPNTSTAG